MDKTNFELLSERRSAREERRKEIVINENEKREKKSNIIKDEMRKRIEERRLQETKAKSDSRKPGYPPSSFEFPLSRRE